MAATRPYIRRAQYYETDQMAVIHHSNYIRWFEEARVDFMDQLGYGYAKAAEAGVDFALLEVAASYQSMVRFGDTVAIHCAVTQCTPSRMAVSYRVLDAASGEVRATGITRHCYYSGRLRRPVSLRKVLPDLYRLLAERCAEGEEAPARVPPPH